MENDKLGDKNKIKGKSSEKSCSSNNLEQKEMLKPTISSSSSLKLKKSTNLLSAFVNRRRNKSKLKDSVLTTVKEPDPNINFVASTSTLGNHTEDDSLGNHEEYQNNEERFSQKHSEKSPNCMESKSAIDQSNIKYKSSFFKKLIKKQAPLPNEQRVSAHLLTAETSGNEACQIGDSGPSSDTAESNNKIPPDELNTLVPTCYVNFGHPTLNVTLANGLQLVQELASRLIESENHFIQLFSRYVTDPACHKELLDTLNQHSKLQWETERRTTSLASDMWLHQIEIGRAQERTLQETLNSIIKQNRQLQIDNETLFRRNEKLMKKMRNFNDLGVRQKCIDCDNRFDNLTKHNERLQYKLDAFCQQIQQLENELHLIQKHNDGLEQQLRNSSYQIHNVKAIYQRSKTDYELEIVNLNHRVMKTETVIKEAMAAGDILMEDLEAIKGQTKNIGLPIKWSNHKYHGNCLADLVHLCRSHINEMAKELIALGTQVRLQKKDIHNLEEMNTKLQESLNRTSSELDCLNRKIDEKSLQETEKMIVEQKYKLLETDTRILKEQMEHQKDKYELEIKSLLEKLQNFEQVNSIVDEKDKMIDQTKMFVNNITSENMTLRYQVENLSKVLSESGAGDVLQELSQSQQQLAFVQTQNYQLVSEKQALMEQLEQSRTDNRAILEQQEANYKQLQKQLHEFELISKENSLIKKQLESEHETVISLQAERMKHLEEKSMLKSVFQHMKSEMARAQKLEGTVTDISKEANKLAMIAEYNKQLGEKLKCEIVDRDKIILQLRSSVEKLNEIQIKNTKEKLSLCYELSELCQAKDKLNNILSIEVKKNMALDDSKKEIAKTASSQIRKFEELQKTERTALKDLIRDFKVVSSQRDQLQTEKDKLEHELTDMKKASKDQMKHIDELVFAKSDVEFKLKDAKIRLDEDKKIIAKLNENITNEVMKYQKNVKELEKLINILQNDKDQLKNSLTYLQNNTAKLHRDLNESRKNEKETRDTLSKSIQEKEKLLKEKDEITNELKNSNEEKEKLESQISNVNTICERILADYESAMKSSTEKEELYKAELDESKRLLLNNANEIQKLNKIIFEKHQELHKLSEANEELRKKQKHCDEALKLIDDSKKEYNDLRDRKFKVDKELCELQVEHKNKNEEIHSLRKEIDNLQQRLSNIVSEKDNELKMHKINMNETTSKIAAIKEKSEAEIKTLRLHLNDISQQLKNERSSYASLSEIHKEISAKLIKSMKDVMEEKNAKEEAATKLKKLDEELASLKADKENLQQQVNISLDGLNDATMRINTLTREKENTISAMEDLQKRYNDLLQKCISLENEVRAPIHNQNKEDLEMSKDQIHILRKELEHNNKAVLSLQKDITELQQHITTLEFQKSEITLKYHEIQRKLQTEQNLCEHLKNTHKLIVEHILKLKDDKRMDPVDCNHIVHMVQSTVVHEGNEL